MGGGRTQTFRKPPTPSHGGTNLANDFTSSQWDDKKDVILKTPGHSKSVRVRYFVIVFLKPRYRDTIS